MKFKTKLRLYELKNTESYTMRLDFNYRMDQK